MKKAIITISISTYILITLFCIFFFPIKYKNEISNCATKLNLDPNLIFAVIKAESDFDPNVVSKSGACGLMQIMPATAKYMIEQYDLSCSLDDLFLPKVNIEIGSQYLRYLLDKYKNLDDVIVAYNAGETTMMNWKKNNQSIQYAETRNYLKRVTRNITFYQRKKSLFV